eukprot:sb/3475704/
MSQQELLHYVFMMRGFPALNGSFLADFYGIQCGCYGNQSSCYGNQSSCYGNQDSCYGNQGRCLGDPSWLISASILSSSHLQCCNFMLGRLATTSWYGFRAPKFYEGEKLVTKRIAGQTLDRRTL